MLLKESIWYRNALARHAKSGVVLNVGSSTKHFMEEQPYIDRHVLQPLRERGNLIYNIDTKTDESVDFTGDISDRAFAATLPKGDVILCANTLEQVKNRTEFVNGLMSLLKPGGVLLVSVPYRYPIYGTTKGEEVDYNYRANLKDVKELFDELLLLEGRKINNGLYFWAVTKQFSLLQKIWFFIKQVVKLVLGIDTQNVRWLFRNIIITCAVFV